MTSRDERQRGGPRVVRLCSVFEVPPAACSGRGARFDPLGGMQNHTGQLTRALDRRGVAQTVVTAYRPGAPRHESLGEHSEVFRLGLPTRRLRQLYSVPAAWRLPRAARTADLVHAHLGEDLAVLPLALAVTRRYALPLVLTLHMSLRHTLVPTDARSAVLRSVGGWLQRVGERRAAAVVALTPSTARLVAGNGVPPDRVHVIPSGVDPSRFSSTGTDRAREAGPPTVVFVGRLHVQKGVETLVQAAAHLPEDTRVVLAGDGPLRARLEALTRDLGLGDRVQFRGFVPTSDVPGLLAGADVFVMPSLYEELGSGLLEAMNAGLAIVASSTGGIPDVVADGVHGLLVPPGDPAALAAAVTRVLRDPDLARRLRENARAEAARYDWNVLADRVLAVYDDVLGRSGPLTPA